jgi:hypothetical protein
LDKLRERLQRSQELFALCVRGVSIFTLAAEAAASGLRQELASVFAGSSGHEAAAIAKLA